MPNANLNQIITTQLQEAVSQAFPELEAASVNPLLTPATNPKFGDYQANIAMPLGKQLGKKPREIAEAIVSQLGESELFEKIDIAGPGFINLTLTASALADAAMGLAGDPKLGTAAVFSEASKQTVVVDYASPNLAKEMHIGHLRSTIIGDAISRVLAFAGYKVIRQNHIGDWGTQFGMLLQHLIDTGWEQSDDQSIGDLNLLYQEAKKRDDEDKDFAERARQRVVALQSGDPEARRIWQLLIGESVRHMNEVFTRLGVLLGDEDLRGESAYNADLNNVADELEKGGEATISDGALCVFLENEESPMIVRKSDGGFGYAATDLACMRYRVNELEAHWLVYVVDARQRKHFLDLFAVGRKVDWAPQQVRMDHVAFGTILGKDNKPFKTRAGGTVKLTDVLDEAEQRAEQVISEKNPDLSSKERAKVANVVGIGSVKYADLSNDRIKDYVFDWDRMLALEGNTAPYLIYAYVRIQSIFRKGEIDPATIDSAAITITHPAEKALLLKVVQFPQVVKGVAESLEPHRMCTYLYELASLYHQFNHHCPVLSAEDDGIKQSRLAISKLTGEVLQTGLDLLGIQTVEHM